MFNIRAVLLLASVGLVPPLIQAQEETRVDISRPGQTPYACFASTCKRTDWSDKIARAQKDADYDCRVAGTDSLACKLSVTTVPALRTCKSYCDTHLACKQFTIQSDHSSACAHPYFR